MPERMGEAGKSLPESVFGDALIRENGLDRNGFENWLFEPGMLFGSGFNWWGERTARVLPHEGLDICLYQNRPGAVFSLDEETLIPALYDGVVAGVIDDFLGETIVMEHRFPGDRAALRGYTFLGHTRPFAELAPGRPVKQGTPVARLAPVRAAPNGTRPHLHLSVGLATSSLPRDQMNWRRIGSSPWLTLVDPLQLLTQPVILPEEV